MLKKLTVLGWLFMANYLNAQVTFVVEQVPSNTPTTASIFMGSALNDWQAQDSTYIFTQLLDGAFVLTLDNIQETPFEFKLTRGDWKNVETDEYGHFIDNRKYEGQEDTVYLQVKTWEDLPLVPNQGWLKVTLTEIPDNTPKDASIYAVGSFNAWHTDDGNYKLEEKADGTLEVLLPLFQDTTLYKFTRGTWETAEGQKNGRARINREFILDNASREVTAEIESWEDLAGSPFTFYTFLLLAASIQGILLILAINSLRNNDLAANRVLSALLFILSLALAARISTYDRDIFNQLPKLLLLPDLIYFLYAPIFLVYINKLLRMPTKAKLTISWIHFLPFVIHLLCYFPLLFMEKEAFISRVVDQSLKSYFIWAGGVALIYNSIYWFIARKTIAKYEKESEDSYAFESNLAFLKVVMWIKLACLLIWALSYFLGGIDIILERELIDITDRTTDILWLTFSFTTFFLGYYTMRQPEIFKLPAPEEPASEIILIEQEKAASMNEQDISGIKESLEQVMASKKPYQNPGLSLAGLAEILELSPHSLSRVINEGYGINFNDFVNSHRIQEFKSLVETNQYPNHTLLAIALMVGFNSKSAFNRSFKKLENQTPREFSQQLKNKVESV